jgi:DNA-3-methyladenine glycosylase
MEKSTKVGRKALISRVVEKAPGAPCPKIGTWDTRGSRLVERTFLEAPPEQVAPRLLGKILAHRIRDENGTKYLAGRIVEVEAYMGPHNETPDPAAHAHRGPTPRNQVLFGPAGHAYVYAIYGKYFCMNVSCETQGKAGSVLIRALEPLAGLEQMALSRGLKPAAKVVKPGQLTSGPSRLCQALGITRAGQNGLDLLDSASPLQLLDDGFAVSEVHVTARIGISHAVDLPLRFSLRDHDCVSGPKRIKGKLIFLR